MDIELREEALEVMQSEYTGVINQLQGLSHGKYDRLVIETETVESGPFLDSRDEQFETGYRIGESIAEKLSEKTNTETDYEVRVKQSHDDWYIDINETRLTEEKEHYRGTVMQLRKNGSGWEIPYTSKSLEGNSKTALEGIARYCRMLDGA